MARKVLLCAEKLTATFEAGSTACTDCTTNSNSTLGANTKAECKCNLGYTGPDGGWCSECQPGTYKDMSGEFGVLL